MLRRRLRQGCAALRALYFSAVGTPLCLTAPAHIPSLSSPRSREMIVDNNNTRDQKAAPPPAAPDVRADQPSPPEYSRSYQALQQQYLHEPHIPLRVGTGERASWRFVKAFCAAVAIWVLLGAVTRGIVDIASSGSHEVCPLLSALKER
jgi:hypothetical protein